MSRRRPNRELLLRQLNQLDEHRRNLRDRVFPAAWQRFVGRLPTDAGSLQRILGSSPPRKLMIMRDGWEKDERVKACRRERDQERQAVEKARCATLASLVDEFCQLLFNEATNGPVSIRPELTELAATIRASTRDAIRDVEADLVEALVSNRRTYSDEPTSPAVEVQWERLQQVVAGTIDQIEADLLKQLAAATEKASSRPVIERDYDKRNEILIQLSKENPNLNRRELAARANDAPRIVELGFRGTITEETIKTARKSRKTGKNRG